MVREDLISGAVSFLHDPSVASAPLEQRVAFLKSKNLTQEEIDIAIQRVGSESVAPQQQIAQNFQHPQQGYRPNQGYGYWPPPPPPEPPRRDWRDWFIMATVVGGIGYGAFVLAKRYVYPIVAPPTPAQLGQDKASIDASFVKAFALLDQLATDTEELKASEKQRTERLDQALSDVEAVIGNMKDASRKREDEIRRTNDDVRSLRDLIPKAIKTQEENTELRLKELAKEMQSLKTLIASRINTPAARPSTYENPTAAAPSVASIQTISQPQLAEAVTASDNTGAESASVSQTPARSATASPFSGRLANGRAKIPAWQMAASQQAEQNKQDTTDSGTAVEAGA